MHNFSSGPMILSCAAYSAPSAAQPKSAGNSEAALAKLDIEQTDIVANADFARLTALAAPGLTINAPTRPQMGPSAGSTFSGSGSLDPNGH